ncbi:P-loop containing nucleoside triphosphate hydrolase protein [Umbelopsis sp. AD052]|nr:P-loop containing nucleoside triphosphate hydrolase protein [Umbelopsis sp. AD052]
MTQGREEIFRATQSSPKPAADGATYGGEWVDLDWQRQGVKGSKKHSPFVHYTTPHDTRSFKLQVTANDAPYFVEVEVDHEAFRDHPIVPSREELLNPPAHLLKHNTMPSRERRNNSDRGQIPGVPIMRVFGPYDDVDQYAHTQFELLRYDCLIPLQMAISSYKTICHPPDLTDQIEAATYAQRYESLQRNFRVYENVQLDSLVFGFHQVVYRISFRLPYGVSVNWEASKRLIPGTLVLLSKDGFENDIKVACVAHREVKPLTGRNRFEFLLDISVENDNDADPLGYGDPNETSTPHVMLEATSGYFEAYKHIMTVLQDVTPSTLPLASHLISLDKKIGIPKYASLKRFYDLSLEAPTAKGEPPKFPVDITKLFPPYPEMGLDETQYRALQRILSRKVSIVQGPPGTGKTHVGLAATLILLKNFENDVSLGPIVCICQTNHAIDQFLEHILKHNQNIVRVGGRSKSEALTNHTLYELRKAEREMGLSRIFRKRHELQKKINDLLYEMYEEPCVSIDFITKTRLLSPQQIDSLKRMADPNQSKDKKTQLDDDLEDEWVINSDIPTNFTKNRGQHEGNHAKKEPVVNKKPPNPVEMWLGGAVSTVHPLQVLPGYEELNIAKGEFLEQQKGLLIDKEADEEDAMDEEEVRDNIQNFKDESSSGNKKDPRIGLNRTYWFQPSNPSKGSAPVNNAPGASNSLAERRAVNYEWKDNSVGEQRRTTWQLSDDWKVWCRGSNDLRQWPMAVRLQAHRAWVDMRNKDIVRTIRSITKQYSALSRDFKAIRTATDAKICRRNRVIGMTSTAAAKYHRLLEAVKPRVIIFEEAGEMLESHIISSITSSTQHIILIGDQQQLRPDPSVYALGEYHNFNVSLFERLIVNDMPFTRLSHQRRMAPKIRSLVNPIYRNPPLMDHPYVHTYRDIPGMMQNLFFLIHNEPESHISESASKYNEHEAQMAVLLASYMIMQGIPPDMITILTMYSGQLRKLRECLRKERRMGEDINLVRISSVDGFQGEESEVVILSLVRSNSMGAIGFLKVVNRVCVALSRAKKGMYIIGNGAMLCQRSELWNEIIGNLEDQHPDCIGEQLMLRCQQHPDRVTSVTYPVDFKDVEEGGCGHPCEIILPCGHKCPAKCHVYPHEDNIVCRQPCLLTHPTCGHRCLRQCREPCGKCLSLVRVRMNCGHEMEIACGDTTPAKCNKCLPSSW